MPQASALKKAAPAKAKSHSRRRLVIPAWEDTDFSSYALGGKGHGIARLMKLGLPTPPALVISTSLCRSYQETGQLPKRFDDQLERELKTLELKTGKRFGDPANPLLVSVRSGAMISMPGMMETVLNVGLTEPVALALRAQYGDSFVDDCQRHFDAGLGLHVRNMVLTDSRLEALAQLRSATYSVLESWHSNRARAYRREHNINERLGTAVTIQEMVFGNRAGSGECGTGVALSHHPDTAEPGLFGNYLPSAQGHDLVSGEVTPKPISSLTDRFSEYATTLTQALVVLESEVNGPVEVEFTVEDGVLYFLQFRAAKLSPEATIINLVRRKEAGEMTRDEVVETIPERMAEAVAGGTVLKDPIIICDELIVARGEGVGCAAVNGTLVSTAEHINWCTSKDVPYILVRKTTTPDDFELMLGAAGIITQEGGSTCHAAVVARHQGIPAVIGIGVEDFAQLHRRALTFSLKNCLDAKNGVVLKHTMEVIETVFGREVSLFHKWRQTGKPVIQPELCQEEFATNTALNDFYLAEAMLKTCTDEALAVKIRRVHKQLTARTSEVFSTYLALAVASEVTHADNYLSVGGANEKALLAEMRSRFTLTHRNSWPGLTAPPIAHELATAGSSVVTGFFQNCKVIFGCGHWTYAAMGGQNWANIAAVGELYWNGDIAVETFVDRVFDLEHNTATVLNKHRMVYDHSRGSSLTRQLDTKRRELSVTKKWAAMRALHNEVNQELINLYEEGRQKGIWK